MPLRNSILRQQIADERQPTRMADIVNAMFDDVLDRLNLPRPSEPDLSEGHELVSHFRNVNAHGRFWWVREGEPRVEFDPMFPNDRRAGSTPDDLVNEMAAVGFDVAPPGTGAAVTGSRFAELSEPWVDPVAGSFALTERLTGVAVSRELLDEATYFCAEPRSLG